MAEINSVTEAVNLPFEEAIDWFREKDPNYLTERYDDLTREEYQNGFAVAGIQNAQQLANMRQAVDSYIAEGKSIQDFRKDFDANVKKYGWSYNGSRGWRSQLIANQNAFSAYGAGRWEQINDPELMRIRPYREIRAGGSLEPNQEHAYLTGLVLPATDPFWEQLGPPPWDYGCKHQIVTLSKEEGEKKKGQKPKLRGIKLGFTAVSRGQTIAGLWSAATAALPEELALGLLAQQAAAQPAEQAGILSGAAIQKILEAIKRAIAVTAAAAFVAGSAFIAIRIARDPLGASQALTGVYNSVQQSLGLRDTLPKLTTKVERFVSRGAKKTDIDESLAKALGGSLEMIKAEAELAAKDPKKYKRLQELRQRLNLATPEDRYNYSLKMLDLKHRQKDYKFALHKFSNQIKTPPPYPEEVAALRYYTDLRGYEEMNLKLRGKLDILEEKSKNVWKDPRPFDRILEDTDFDIKMVNSALSSLPDYTGRVYRGLTLPDELIDTLSVGGFWEETGFMSTTLNPIQRYPGNTVFVIQSKTGKDIRAYEKYLNNEVLFAPGSRFEITEKRVVREFGQEFTLIKMTEVERIPVTQAKPQTGSVAEDIKNTVVNNEDVIQPRTVPTVIDDVVDMGGDLSDAGLTPKQAEELTTIVNQGTKVSRIPEAELQSTPGIQGVTEDQVRSTAITPIVPGSVAIETAPKTPLAGIRDIGKTIAESYKQLRGTGLKAEEFVRQLAPVVIKETGEGLSALGEAIAIIAKQSGTKSVEVAQFIRTVFPEFLRQAKTGSEEVSTWIRNVGQQLKGPANEVMATLEELEQQARNALPDFTPVVPKNPVEVFGVDLNQATKQEILDAVPYLNVTQVNLLKRWTKVAGPLESIDDLAKVPGISQKVADQVKFAQGLININNLTSAVELTRIRGISRTIADAIVADIKQNGSFASRQDLQARLSKIKGVGPAKIKALESRVYIGPTKQQQSTQQPDVGFAESDPESSNQENNSVEVFELVSPAIRDRD